MKGMEDLSMITDVGLIKLSIPALIFRFLRFHVLKLLLEFFSKDATLNYISARRLRTVSERIFMPNKLFQEHDK